MFQTLLAPLWLVLVSMHVQHSRPPVLTRPSIRGIAFVSLRTADLALSRKFYGKLLGYDLHGTKDSHELTITINSRQHLHLRDGLLPGQDERLEALAFQTDEVAGMRAFLASKGVVVPPALSKDALGQLYFEVQDPDGHPVQFVAPAANANVPVKNVNQGAISARILHAGLTIRSVAAADSFYQRILGFSEIWRGGATDSVTSWINMRVPDGTDYLEYMLTGRPVSRQELGSLHHVALLVPDMQQALDLLNSRKAVAGFPVAAPRIGRNRRWQLNLFDPDGTRIELMEPFPMR